MPIALDGTFRGEVAYEVRPQPVRHGLESDGTQRPVTRAVDCRRKVSGGAFTPIDLDK
jgi:hypothetical protein